jgi:hypothetical protein
MPDNPPIFRIVVQAQNVNGAQNRHVRISVKRGDNWAVCGILMLQPAEWDTFHQLCIERRIEVTPDDAPPKSSVPADTAAAAR